MGRLAKRKCRWCFVWFDPVHRLGDRQKSCGRDHCQWQQKLLSHQQWRRREREDFLQGLKDWRDAHPDYWKRYRREHPVYTERNRNQSRLRKSFREIGLQKRIDILEVTEKQMEFWHLPRFAKQPRSLTPLLFVYTTPHDSVLPGSLQSQAP